MPAIDVHRALTQRHDIAETLNDHRWLEVVGGDYARTFTGAKQQAEVERIAHTIVYKWRHSLEVSETFTLTGDLQTVVTAAAEDLPDEWVAEHHHLYVEHGFLSLARPFADEVRGDVEIHALTWHHGQGDTTRYRQPDGSITEGPRHAVPGIEINLWGWALLWSNHLNDSPQTSRRVWLPVGSDFLPYGLPSLGFVLHGVDEKGLTIETPETTLSMATRIVLVLQSFMRQELPGIQRWPVPRADQRRMRRFGLHQPTVTVIDLRRRQTAEREDHTGRVLTYRHLVRGHWHHYWVGPGHSLHSGLTDDRERVPVYLSPYLKGPEGAPIRPTPERVHRVAR